MTDVLDMREHAWKAHVANLKGPMEKVGMLLLRMQKARDSKLLDCRKTVALVIHKLEEQGISPQQTCEVLLIMFYSGILQIDERLEL